MMRKLLFMLVVFCVGTNLQAQDVEVRNIGGEPLEALKKDSKERFVYYVFDYLRLLKTFSVDNTFDDYLNNGKQYTIFVPEDDALEEYYKSNGGRNGNIPRLRNTIKYNIVQGVMMPIDFQDGKQLRTLFGSGSIIDVSVKKNKVTLKDMHGNKVKLGKPIVFENIIIYPVSTFLRYK